MSERNETSVWKKEITFRRRPKAEQPVVAAAPAAQPAETSVWKKEISFRRKPKAQQPTAPPAQPAETSVWKKEISFRRKPQQAAPYVVPPPTEPPRAEWTAPQVPAEDHLLAPEVLPPVTPPPSAAWSPPPMDSVGREHDLRPPERTPAPAEPPFAPPPPAQHAAPPAEQLPVQRAPEQAHPPPVVPPPYQPAVEQPRFEQSTEAPPFVEAPEVAPVQPAPELAPVERPPDPAPLEEAPEHAPYEPAAEQSRFELPPEFPPAEHAPYEQAPYEAAAEQSRFELPPEFPPAEQAPEHAPFEPVEEHSRFELPPEVPAFEEAPEHAPYEQAPEYAPYDPAAEHAGSELPPEVVPTEVVPPELVPALQPLEQTAVAQTAPLPAPAELDGPPEQEHPGERPSGDRLAKERQKQAKEFARRQRKSGTAAQNRVVGLKVGASQVAAAYLLNKGGPRIVKMARMPLKRGIVVGGELREPEELAAALKAFFRKNKLPQNCVRLGISNNRIGVRTFEISGIDDEKQLANAIRFRAQEALPIPLDEAVLDYRILDERLDDEGVKVRRVLLVVAHRELVERYVAACRKAGLKLVGIDLEAFALLRALSDPAHPPAEDAAVVCVSIGHDRSTLAVSDGKICEFTRVLAWGGSVLDVALARVLDLTPSAVEPIKHELVLGEDGEAAGLDAHHAHEARAAMAAELQTFARELVASLRFYQEQPNSLGIAEILLTGGATATHGLATELERLIGIPVRIADPFARVRAPRHGHEEHSESPGSLAVAVGLGIED